MDDPQAPWFHTYPNGSLFFEFAPDHSFPHFQAFLSAYCINPPDDTCGPPGRCPNLDAAGILVRVSAYATNFFIGLVMLYSPEEATGSFWSLLLFVYSLLITSSLSIAQRSMTRFHVEITTELAGSPLTFLIFIYVILALRGRNHRMDVVLSGSRRHLIGRALVVSGILFWMALVVFSELSTNNRFFPQSACDGRMAVQKVEVASMILPYAAIAIIIWQAFFGDYYKIGEAAPVAILLIVCILCVYLQRKAIRAAGGGKMKFWPTWTIFRDQYPFIHACLIFVFPLAYWVLVIEDRLTGSHDNHYDTSFGQILAVFSIVAPMFQSFLLVPRFWAWFIDLSWVRFLSCRRQRKRSDYKELSDYSLPPLVQHGPAAPPYSEPYRRHEGQHEMQYYRKDDYRTAQQTSYAPVPY